MYRKIYDIFLVFYALFELDTLTGLTVYLPSLTSLKSWMISKISNLQVYIEAIRIIFFPRKSGSIEHSRYRTIITYSEYDASDELVERILLLPNISKTCNWKEVYAVLEPEEEFSSTESDTEDEEGTLMSEEKKREKELLDDIKLGHIWINVTPEILKVCGPRKDFYNVRITPKTINESWTSLKFQGNTSSSYVVYESEEIINPSDLCNL